MTESDLQQTPLTVEIVDGKLVISIGVETLAFAVWHGDVLDDGDRIADVDAFARDVVRQLVDEDEEGTTPVHKLLDEAALTALDQGDTIDSVRLEGENDPADTPRALHVLVPSTLDGLAS